MDSITSTLASEGPAILGYLAVLALILLVAGISALGGTGGGDR